ncbi:MAG TPA: hypothetical protein VFS08_11600 [Gemmatimonadaceae bacterium]|nr:hypothetical protein [Gemmatimonadaceae bacterium]
MPNERVRAGVLAGVLAAAATMGGVLALAWRAGSAWRPFVETGRAVLGSADAAAAGVLGFGLQLGVAVGWGLVLALVAYRARGALLLLAAAAVAAVAYAVHSVLLPAFRLGFGVGVFPVHGAPLVFLYVLFALALALGMRLAR